MVKIKEGKRKGDFPFIVCRERKRRGKKSRKGQRAGEGDGEWVGSYGGCGVREVGPSGSRVEVR